MVDKLVSQQNALKRKNNIARAKSVIAMKENTKKFEAKKAATKKVQEAKEANKRKVAAAAKN